MSARSVLVGIGVIAGIGLIWWASGLGRGGADPREFFSAEQIARANEYQTPRQWAFLGRTVLGIAALAVLAFTVVGDRLLAPVRSWPWPVAVLAAVLLVVLAVALVRLPLSFFAGHLHEQAWGFSTRGAGSWFADWGKSVGIQAVINGIAVLALVGLVRALPRAWPAAAATVIAGLVVLVSFLFPVLIEPVFSRFEPLPDRAFAAELSALAERAGVPVREVLVSDASRRTTKENAYVSGFGTTKRLVVYDTLLRADRGEVELVVAHELGHRRKRHVELGTAIGAAAAAAAVVAFWLVLRSSAVLEAVRSPAAGDVRIVPFVLLFVAVLTLVAQPPSNALSRAFEEDADRFALELIADRETYVEAERGLALRNLGDLDPGPFVYRFLFTHPAPAERVAIAEEMPSAGQSPHAPQWEESPGSDTGLDETAHDAQKQGRNSVDKDQIKP